MISEIIQVRAIDQNSYNYNVFQERDTSLKWIQFHVYFPRIQLSKRFVMTGVGEFKVCYLSRSFIFLIFVHFEKQTIIQYKHAMLYDFRTMKEANSETNLISYFHAYPLVLDQEVSCYCLSHVYSVYYYIQISLTLNHHSLFIYRCVAISIFVLQKWRR